MPLQQILPTWLALNGQNATSATALTDLRTGQPFAAGGLNLGDYFDVTNEEAAQMSNLSTGLLFEGRYRFVQVDSGATAANVKTGTVGFLRAGSVVKGVVITNAGSGGTAGTYNIAASPASGGGVGAVISVTVGSGGTVTSASVVQGGFNYTAVPTFNLTTGSTAIPGLTGATVAAQLGSSPNIVTSADQAVSSIRPVVFLNAITPGNYGFVQELGTATVLGKSSISGSVGDYINAVLTDSGTVTSTVASGSPIGSTIGRAIDTPQQSLLFKCYLGGQLPITQD